MGEIREVAVDGKAGRKAAVLARLPDTHAVGRDGGPGWFRSERQVQHPEHSNFGQADLIIPCAVHLRAGQTDPHRPRRHSGGNVDEKRRAGTGAGQVRLEHDLIIHVGKPQREPVHRRVIRRGAVDDLEARERERTPQLHRPETARDIGGQAGGSHHAIQRVGGDVRGGGVAGLCDA